MFLLELNLRKVVTKEHTEFFFICQILGTKNASLLLELATFLKTFRPRLLYGRRSFYNAL